MPAPGIRASTGGQSVVEVVEGCIWHPSPNFGDRRGAASPDMVVVHYTAMDSAAAALARLCDPSVEVSAHYLIGRDGACWQMVDETHRAWHAGAGCWGGRDDVNSRSIGIELDNDGSSPFSEPLMTRLETLLADILARHSIPARRVIGHSDMAPGRKIDPGRRFDWERLARQGLACWPLASAGDEGASAPETPASPARFGLALQRIGYPEDASLDCLLDAFRARFRQHGRGPLTASDVILADRVAHDFPVDRARPAT